MKDHRPEGGDAGPLEEAVDTALGRMFRERKGLIKIIAVAFVLLLVAGIIMALMGM